jgi:hypothetical protein
MAIRKIPLNAAGGAQVVVLATICSRRVEVVEDGGTAAQGFTYQRPEDGFTGTFQLPSATSQVPPGLVLGNIVGHGNNQGGMIGVGPQPNAAATTLLKATSASATPNAINVNEHA